MHTLGALTADARLVHAGVGGRLSARGMLAPDQLVRDVPLTQAAADVVRNGRIAARDVLHGNDDRLLVLVGPCSIHDVSAGVTYAKMLRDLTQMFADDLLMIMRVYVEKPRTVLGWPGLLAQPDLDGRPDFNRGFQAAREMMLEVAELGVAIATEWLSPAAPSYLADLVSWAAIGARTVESQVHRQLASGLPMPIGMKNASSGWVGAAVDAIRSAAAPHAFLSAGADGRAIAVHTTGNPDCHVVLRGGSGGPNYSAVDVRSATELLAGVDLPTGLVIDASHGNCGKDHVRQAMVAREIGAQIAAGAADIRGVMLESFLVPGKQNVDARELVFGQSVTDACMGWETTTDILRDLAMDVRERRGRCR